MRKGEWDHVEYGMVVVDDQVLDEVVANFKNRER
jgi:hypothetical protein